MPLGAVYLKGESLQFFYGIVYKSKPNFFRLFLRISTKTRLLLNIKI